jgi:neuropeptide F receptor
VTCILASIWIICAIFCIPCYEYRKLVHYHFDILELGFKQTISYCIEEWPVIAGINGGVYYSLFSVFVQYFIPIVVLSGAYMRIYMRLKQRIVLTQAPSVSGGRIQNRSQNRDQKMRRTNCLLISIFLIFGVSWLPMNIFNFYVDWTGIVMNHEGIYIIYAVCHMMGMSSGTDKVNIHHIYVFSYF